jgi:hypothetical protein
MNISEIVSLIASLNWLEVVGAVTTILVGLIALFELIPGEQPEKTLRAIVNFIAKFSRK